MALIAVVKGVTQSIHFINSNLTQSLSLLKKLRSFNTRKIPKIVIMKKKIQQH